MKSDFKVELSQNEILFPMLQNGWGKKSKAITITLILLSLQESFCLSVYLCVCEFGAFFLQNMVNFTNNGDDCFSSLFNIPDEGSPRQ